MPSVVTSVIGGIQGASAAHHAADAVKAGNTAAIGTMNDTVSRANNEIKGTAQAAGDKVIGTAAAEGDKVVNTAKSNSQILTDSAKSGSDQVIAAGDKAAAGLDQFATTGRDASKTLDGYLAEGGKLNHDATSGEILAQDPGYQFRMQQGNQAMMRAQAAGGGVGGGGAMKAMQRYGQGMASDEYGKAFDRYRATNNDLYDHLSGTAGQGQQAAEYQGNITTDASKFGAGLTTSAASQNSRDINAAQEYAGNANINGATYAGNVNMQGGAIANGNTMEGGKYAGDLESDNGRAQASGIMGASNSWSQMLGGIGQAANSAILGGFGGGGKFNFGGALTGDPSFGKAAAVPAGGGGPQWV